MREIKIIKLDKYDNQIEWLKIVDIDIEYINVGVIDKIKIFVKNEKD